MVREIGTAWQSLEKWFAISWSGCISTILDLQRKDRLPQIAESAGISHPISVIVRTEDDVSDVTEKLGYPCIVKPAQPLSSFKVHRVDTEIELRNNLNGWSDAMPVVAQEWIGGSDTDLYFYSGLWKSGIELGSFSGRKIRSIPPAMGQGTVLEGNKFDDVMRLGRKFAEFVEIDGPISVEFKRGADGQLSMIEPNVGRSEYCVDLLIQSGFNLPLMEYRSTIPDGSVSTVDFRTKRSWYDTERDAFGYLRDSVESRSVFPRGTKPIFPYFGHNDLKPLTASIASRIMKIASGGVRRLLSLLSMGSRDPA
jgi:predicted ATP-grasp superfamily ATP-dependent carboligase